MVRQTSAELARVLLDRLLTDARIPPESVAGPETTSHLEVAMAIASQRSR